MAYYDYTHPALHPQAWTWRSPWVRYSVGGLLALTLASLLVGFVWLPSVHRDFTARGLWDGICRAAGVPAAWRDPAAAARRSR